MLHCNSFGTIPLASWTVSPDLPLGTAPGGLPAKINAPSGLALLGSGTSVSLAVVDSFENAILEVVLP
jgi:hypothetical protein